MGIVQLGVVQVQLGSVQMGVVQLGVVQLGVVQMGVDPDLSSWAFASGYAFDVCIMVWFSLRCFILYKYQIIPKQNTTRGKTIGPSDYCEEKISSKRFSFLNTKAPFKKRKTTKALGGFGLATQLPGWHSLPATNRNTQNASCKTQLLRSTILLKLHLPSSPTWTDTNFSMRTFPLLLLLSLSLIAIASGLHFISVKKC